MEYGQLVAAVQIESVRLIDSTCRTKISAGSAVDGELAADLGHGAKLRQPLVDGLLVYRTHYRFIVRPLDAPTDPTATPPEELVSIRAGFEVCYRLPVDTDAPSGEVLEKFGQHNAIFNTWPYWREYLQSQLARMSLPTFMLPVFRLPNHPADALPDGKPREVVEGQVSET